MFKEHLKRIVDNCGGGIGGMVMGLDGIPVDTYVREGETADISTMGMEFSFILTQVKKAADILEIGGLLEVAIRAERITLVIRMLSPEYFVVVGLSPDGNFGKLRFLMRVTAPKLSAEL